MKTPLPHQKKALKDIAACLKRHSRGKVLMATGTGKTLIALWAAKAQAKDSVLVLVPSLALARQMYEDWRSSDVKNNASGSDWLVVCSDPSVTEGSEEETPEEFEATRKALEESGARVVNDAVSINAFLSEKRRKPAIILSTYQSAELLAEGLPRKFKFDIGIFDEGHKTAGSAGKLFSFALLDKNVPITKRLFFTATPRRSTYKGKNGAEKLIFHMDDESIYGPVAHSLSFKQALDQDLVVDYDVILAVIQMPGLSREDILATKEQALLAKTLMVMKTADKYGAKKIFSFHETNARAAVAEGLYREYRRGFKTYRIDGTQDTQVRADTLARFASDKKAIVTNSRCLGEGVNVPVCDAVAFLSPRRSRVDVIQAVGRACRKVGPAKRKAYVILPIFFEDGDTVETAKKKSAFADAFDTLEALREHNAVLADEILKMREYIQNPELRKGPTRLDDAKIKIEVDGILNAGIAGMDIPAFKKAFKVALLDEVRATVQEKIDAILLLAAKARAEKDALR